MFISKVLDQALVEAIAKRLVVESLTDNEGALVPVPKRIQEQASEMCDQYIDDLAHEQGLKRERCGGCGQDLYIDPAHPIKNCPRCNSPF